MSVYIKGFPLPNNCGACPLRLAWCRERIYMVTRPERCPLVPVPEHGPLVDALDVINTFPEEFIFTNEQARALTNYIIPADPAKEGEG